MNNNHEIWVKCSGCALEFDIRLSEYCTECKHKNKI